MQSSEVTELTTHRLKTPLTSGDIKKLEAGDTVFLSGTLFSMRDQAHKRALDKGLDLELEGHVIYHCGPLVKDNSVISAGPTTSSRMNALTPSFINRFKIRGIIGKGGMDKGVLKALGNKAVYLSFPGGCGLLAARAMRVKDVIWEDLGMPEALWTYEVEDFGPLIVSMAHGKSLYER